MVGIISMLEVKNHLQYVDSVMIGRQAYTEPMILNEMQLNYEQILEKLFHYGKQKIRIIQWCIL